MTTLKWIVGAFLLLVLPVTSAAGGKQAKAGDEKSYKAVHSLTVKVRVVLPQMQESDVQILCFFKHKAKGDKMLSTIQQFDDLLGGLITALRNRGEFVGDELETIVITPPPGSIKAKKLLLIGLGPEEKLSAETMLRVGTVALRETARLGAKHVAFGAAIRDQGNDKIPVGVVAGQVVKGMILAFDTEKRLHKQGIGIGAPLEEWIYEAGPEFFNVTFPGVEEAVASANAAVKARPDLPYSVPKKP